MCLIFFTVLALREGDSVRAFLWTQGPGILCSGDFTVSLEIKEVSAYLKEERG